MRQSRLLVAWALAAIGAAGCGGATAATQPRMYTAVADDAPPAGPAVPPVYVHLVADRGAVLQRLSTRDDDWKDVCTAPCDGYVPAFGSYRVSITERAPTAPFTLPGPPGTSVALKADDDGNVWTRDSLELRARRSGTAAGSAAWIATWALLRR
jgi:hypothetical protein